MIHTMALLPLGPCRLAEAVGLVCVCAAGRPREWQVSQGRATGGACGMSRVPGRRVLHVAAELRAIPEPQDTRRHVRDIAHHKYMDL